MRGRIVIWLLVVTVFLLQMVAFTDTLYSTPSVAQRVAQNGIQGKMVGSSQRVHASRPSELFHKGRLLEEKGSIDEAIAVYEELIRRFPRTTYESETGTWKYSDDARDRLNVLLCLKSRGKDFSASSPDKLANAIAGAFRRTDHNRLVQYASCDFFVGRPETDAVWHLPPDEVIPIIAQLGQRLDWSIVSLDPRGNLIFQSQQGEEHVFMLKAISARYKWTGYYTTQRSILDRLWEAREKTRQPTPTLGRRTGQNRYLF